MIFEGEGAGGAGEGLEIVACEGTARVFNRGSKREARGGPVAAAGGKAAGRL